jgi:glycosyltransferase involved in cell wall biosynthesis
MRWLLAYIERPWREEPEIDKLDRINPDGSYIGGAVISLLRVMKYLRRMGHQVDLDDPSPDPYDVLLICRKPDLIERHAGVSARRKFLWLHDRNHRDELTRYRDWYDGVITVSPFVTSLYDGAHPHVLTSTNPMEPVDAPRHEPDHLSLCFAGMFSVRRNVHFALEVLAHLRQELPDAHLMLYGSYSLWADPANIVRYGCDASYLPLVEQALRNVAPDSVTFAGNIANTALCRRLAGHHFLLVPANVEETCSMVSIEAQSVGTVVIASPYGALPDTVGPGGVCLELDAKLWAETIAGIYRSGWNEYSRAARDHFHRRFRMDRAMDSWIRFVQGART